jgi:hypothetical protein
LAVISTVGAAKMVNGTELKTTTAVITTAKLFLVKLLLDIQFISIRLHYVF